MFATNMQKTAKRLIDKYGNVAFIVKITQGAYDTIDGKTNDLRELYGIKAYLDDVNTSDVVAGVVNIGDVVALFYTNIEIEKKDGIQIAGKDYNIISIKTTTTQDKNILYEIVIRA